MAESSPQVIKCKAAVAWKAGEAIKVEEILVDPPKASEVRIKMLFSSLCHTDILCCGGVPEPLYPRVAGHEGVGIVENIGEEVNNVKEGDIVIPLYLGECGKCLNCKSGKTNICHAYPLIVSGLMPDGTSRMTTLGGEKIYHHYSCSTWSEYTVVDSNYVVKVDPRLHLPHASFLSCGFTSGLGSTWRAVSVEQGSSVVVLGLGAVGLGVVKGAKMQGATKIIGVDLNDLKREKGEIFGMTDFINPKDSGKLISELVKEATGGLGVDYCFQCTGASSLLNEAIECTKVGLGATVLVAAGYSITGQINLIPIMSGHMLKGTIFGGVRIQSDLPVIIDKCVNKEIHLEELLTHEVGLNEINEALAIMKRPECVKILIKF